MSGYECADCGVAAMDVPDVDPEYWFERDKDGAMRCGGCQAIADADRRWKAGDW